MLPPRSHTAAATCIRPVTPAVHPRTAMPHRPWARCPPAACCRYLLLCAPQSVVAQCAAQPQIRELRPAMQYHTAVQQMCQPTGAAAVAAPVLPQCSECSATSIDPDKVTVQALEANCPDPLGELAGHAVARTAVSYFSGTGRLVAVCSCSSAAAAEQVSGCVHKPGWLVSLCGVSLPGCLPWLPLLPCPACRRHPGQHLPGGNHPAGQLHQLDRVLRQRSRQRLLWAVWRGGRWWQGAGHFGARPRPCPHKGSRTLASIGGAGARARWGACCFVCRAVPCIVACGRCRGGALSCQHCTSTAGTSISTLHPTVCAATCVLPPRPSCRPQRAGRLLRGPAAGGLPRFPAVGRHLGGRYPPDVCQHARHARLRPVAAVQQRRRWAGWAGRPCRCCCSACWLLEHANEWVRCSFSPRCCLIPASCICPLTCCSQRQLLPALQHAGQHLPDWPIHARLRGLGGAVRGRQQRSGAMRHRWVGGWVGGGGGGRVGKSTEPQPAAHICSADFARNPATSPAPAPLLLPLAAAPVRSVRMLSSQTVAAVVEACRCAVGALMHACAPCPATCCRGHCWRFELPMGGPVCRRLAGQTQTFGRCLTTTSARACAALFSLPSLAAAPTAYTWWGASSAQRGRAAAPTPCLCSASCASAAVAATAAPACRSAPALPPCAARQGRRSAPCAAVMGHLAAAAAVQLCP